MTIASPCKGNCRLDATGESCTGCGRTMAEITAWAGMTDAAREVVLAKLAQRKEGLLF